MAGMIVNLRADPYEKGFDEADMGYLSWYADNMWLFVPIQGVIKAVSGLHRRLSVPGGHQPERRRH
jgi:hypothetical protein